MLRFIYLISFSFLLCSCGTLTGIPSHGGGKRFATEQRLVSASVRAALKDMDVSKLRGKKTAIIFDLISDEGGGNLSGGRLNLETLLSVGSMAGPTTTAASAFQIFNLRDSGTNYSNTGSSTSSGTETVTLSNGSGSSSSSTTGSSTSTASGSESGTTVSSGTSQSSGTNTTTTGSVTTNGSFSENGSTTDNSSTTSTSTSTTTGSSSTTNSGSSSSSNSSSSTQTASSTTSSSTSGGYNRNHQEISPAPTRTVTKTEGTKRELKLSAAYRGLGEYINFNVPKSDASFLMGLVRNYLLLNGVIPTTPTDREAEIVLYVTVDIFGIVRSRFDTLLYNSEKVQAETAFEMMAYDKDGKLVMAPQSSNRMAQYIEHYLLWSGPVMTSEKIQKGEGLLVNFSNVNGGKTTFNSGKDVNIYHFLGKN